MWIVIFYLNFTSRYFGGGQVISLQSKKKCFITIRVGNHVTDSHTHWLDTGARPGTTLPCTYCRAASLNYYPINQTRMPPPLTNSNILCNIHRFPDWWAHTKNPKNYKNVRINGRWIWDNSTDVCLLQQTTRVSHVRVFVYILPVYMYRFMGELQMKSDKWNSRRKQKCRENITINRDIFLLSCFTCNYSRQIW